MVYGTLPFGWVALLFFSLSASRQALKVRGTRNKKQESTYSIHFSREFTGIPVPLFPSTRYTYQINTVMACHEERKRNKKDEATNSETINESHHPQMFLSVVVSNQNDVRETFQNYFDDELLCEMATKVEEGLEDNCRTVQTFGSKQPDPIYIIPYTVTQTQTTRKC